MSDDIRFIGTVNISGTRHAKFSMQMGSQPATFQQSAVQLRTNIEKMKELGKSPEKIAIFQEGLDAL